MNEVYDRIIWNKKEFFVTENVFTPKGSSISILDEIDTCLQQFKIKIPILDLCCGIGAIGISALLRNQKAFSKFYGFDNDKESIEICRKNIKYHKIKGKAYIWQAGERLIEGEGGIAVCNPPFLPVGNNYHDSSIKSPFSYCNDDGLEVLLKCFESLIGTNHILILKSLENQISLILDRVSDHFILLRKSDQVIKSDYIISFTTWSQK